MTEPQTAWLSEGLEVLLAEIDSSDDKASAAHFDVLIVGSGYGGAIAAARLAGAKNATGKKLRIAVLERGNEYLPGMFPATMANLAGHARVVSPVGDKVVGNRDGLFDIRVGGDISAVVANGLGGGSLINAGVMAEPSECVFDHHWPTLLRGRKELDPFYRSVKLQLGAVRGETPNTIEVHKGQEDDPPQPNPPDKYLALQTLDGDKCTRAAITVAMDTGPNQSNVQMETCNFCGDCAIGCNHGAKNSLDVNLLVEASRGGARFITGATVMSVLSEGNGWILEVLHTQPQLAKREHTPVDESEVPYTGANTSRNRPLQPARLTADRVILAAGTFGSTEILLRSRERGLQVSRELGKRFSGNGDMLAFGVGQKSRVNAIADEGQRPDKRGIGPTITGMLDLRNPRADSTGKKPPPMVIEEMAVPGPLRQIFEEVVTTAACLQSFKGPDTSLHEAGNPQNDPLAVDREGMANNALYAIMGDDGADGVIHLRGNFDRNSDGGVMVKWPGLAQHPLFPAQIDTLQQLLDASNTGGQVIANPLWRPLPESIEAVLGAQKGPLLTVHPLGGCAMGDDAGVGVVNDIGQVFTGSARNPTEVYRDLVVMDGSVIPTALSINPALTIAALSARAIDALISEWKLQRSDEKAPAVTQYRPVYRAMPQPKRPGPTTMEFAEQLRGKILLRNGTKVDEFQAEITLFFAEKALHELYAGSSKPRRERQTLHVLPADADMSRVSRLRLFPQKKWNSIFGEGLSGRLLEKKLEQECVFDAPLSGKLIIMGREPTTSCQRIRRAGLAWLLNRGARDLVQKYFPLKYERNPLDKSDEEPGQSLPQYFKMMKDSLSRAGEVRLFEYELELGVPKRNSIDLDSKTSPSILGTKRISYLRRGNPLDQLSTVTLSSFPGLEKRRDYGELKLVPQFLARNGLPLFRIVQQQDGPQALADLISLGAYFLRLLISVHLYTLRKPDTAKPRDVINLPPASLPGLPPRERHKIAIEDNRNAGSILLSRYPGKSACSQPVLLIHGYSASGTTFAHRALPLDLTRYLWSRGHDVWILDLRSSCGAETSTVNFSFEQLAATDIPVAVDHVCQATGFEAIDVVAHCMGAAMFSMAVLDPETEVVGPHYREARKKLPGRIRRTVLSQVGPLVSMAPANIFRAYLFSYIKQWLPLQDYSFSPDPGEAAAGTLLDRLLSAMPYPGAEFDMENPLRFWKRTPWTRARHRMDLLYGHTFALTNMSDAVLEHLDDFFGPLSVDTATQVAHFAKYQLVTDASGFNRFVSRENLRKYWRFPTFSIHGRENRLADVATVERMATIFRDAGCNYRFSIFDDFGHQDCFIGKGTLPIFTAIGKFLQGPMPEKGSISAPGADTMFVQVPWSGPVLGLRQGDGASATLPVSFGCNPGMVSPKLMVVIPLVKESGRFAPLMQGDTKRPQWQVYPAPEFTNGWGKTELPLKDFTGPVHSLLLLMVYDEAAELDNAMFGEDIFAPTLSVLEGCEWEYALKSGASSRIIDAAYPGRTAALVAALTQYARDHDGSIQRGIVTVPQAAQEDQLHLALGSCQYPPGMIDQLPGFGSYQRLADRIAKGDQDSRPDLLLLMGDQVYVDATAGVADPIDPDEHFLQPYQFFYRSREVRKVLREVPATTMLDDHEIADNWQPLPYRDTDNEETLAIGIKHYINFQRGPHQPVDGDKSLHYQFVHNEFHFFIADTRTAREFRTAAKFGGQSLLGRAQEDAFIKWLDGFKEGCTRPKFFVCPSMFAPRTRRALQRFLGEKTDREKSRDAPNSLYGDSWDGYPASFAWVLQQVEKYNVQNLIMLSGDAHLACIAELELKFKPQEQEKRPNLSLWSVHSSPLYAPYPFANGHAEELMGHDQFDAMDAQGNALGQWTARIKFDTTGDGFAYLRVSKPNGQWQVTVAFDRKHGITEVPLALQPPSPPPESREPEVAAIS